MNAAPYPWQQMQWQQCMQAYQNDRLGHAYLLQGPAGLGKRDFALQLAQRLLCTQTMDHSLACGQCRSCKWLQQGSHPDYYKIAAEKSDAAIKVAQIRELEQFAWQSSHQGQRRIVLIEPADAMNVAAANALLKLLEEPPASLLFILISDHAEQLLATVRSRCQLMNFSAVTQQQALDYLQTLDVATENLQSLAALCQGRPLLMHEWLKDDKLQQRQEIIEQTFAVLQQQADPLLAADKLQSLNLHFVSEVLCTLLRDMLFASQLEAKEVLINVDKLADIKQFSATIKPIKLFALLEELLKLRAVLAQRIALNPLLALEGIFMQLSQIAGEPHGAQRASAVTM